MTESGISGMTDAICSVHYFHLVEPAINRIIHFIPHRTLQMRKRMECTGGRRWFTYKRAAFRLVTLEVLCDRQRGRRCRCVHAFDLSVCRVATRRRGLAAGRAIFNLGSGAVLSQCGHPFRNRFSARQRRRRHHPLLRRKTAPNRRPHHPGREQGRRLGCHLDRVCGEVEARRLHGPLQRRQRDGGSMQHEEPARPLSEALKRIRFKVIPQLLPKKFIRIYHTLRNGIVINMQTRRRLAGIRIA